MPIINFFFEDIEEISLNKKNVKQWIQKVTSTEGFCIDTINFIFCSDNFLLDLNRSYLSHHTLTDIITFPYNDLPNPLHGDIFISVERVIENANLFSVSFNQEMNRVIIHGVLHLMGYEDKTKKQESLMREKESLYLTLLNVPRGT
jgi:probable rRNA maturation factor